MVFEVFTGLILYALQVIPGIGVKSRIHVLFQDLSLGLAYFLGVFHKLAGTPFEVLLAAGQVTNPAHIEGNNVNGAR